MAVILLCHPVYGGNPSSGASAAAAASQETPSASSKQPEKRGTVRLTGVPGITMTPGTLRYYSTNTPGNTQQPGYNSQNTQYDNYARTSSTASTPATYDYVKAYPTQPYTTPVQSTYQPQYVLPTPYPTQAIPYSSPSAMFFVLPHGNNGNPYGNYVIVPTPYQALHSPLQYYSSGNNGGAYPTQTPVQRVAFAYVVPQLIPLKPIQSAPNGNNGYQNSRPNQGYYSDNRYPSSDYSYSSGESGYSPSSSSPGYNPSSAEADYSRESYNSEGAYHNRVRKPDQEELNDESRERESDESESVPSTTSSLPSRYSGRGRSLEPYVKG